MAAQTRGTCRTSDLCDRQNNNTYQKLLECVTLEGVREHQAQFQKIADANDDPFYPGTRAAGTEGDAESVAYVAGLLRAAGYQVTLDESQFQFNFPAVLEQLTPVNATYETGVFTNSGTGDVTGNVIPVDINLTPPRDTTSGCEDADFAGLDFSGPNDIALIQRGGPPAPAPVCTFAVKALNAQEAGAEAVILFNQGNTPDREALIVGTLAPAELDIPVVGASFAAGWPWPSPARPPTSGSTRPRPAPTSTCSPSGPASTTTTWSWPGHTWTA
jgi:PA domain